MKNITIFGAICVALAGCNTTSEMPLQSNVWQIETNSQGFLFTGSAGKATMKKAAQRTIAQGYSHFIIVDPQSQSNTVQVGNTPTRIDGSYTANHNYYASGNNLYGTERGRISGTVTGGDPVYATTKDIRVTVVMFRADQPEAATALDAAAILAQK